MKSKLAATTVPFIFIGLVGCPAHYKYEHIRPDGSSCSLEIESYREVKAGEITLLDDCSMDSGAKSLGMNEELVKQFGKLVDKVP